MQSLMIPNWFKVSLLCLTFAVLALTIPVSADNDPLATPEPSLPRMSIAVPGYFYPEESDCVTDCYWSQMKDSSPTVAMAIANPNSGSGETIETVYSDAIKTLQDSNISVLGYVYTSWGQRDIDEAKAEIDNYYEWYAVDGIFFDEASTDCADVEFYRELYRYTKAKNEPAQVVINPGINTEACYADAADVIVIYEDSYENYVDWELSGWEVNYPAEKFWHIIHSTQPSDLTTAIDLAAERGAGWIYVTSDIMGDDDNPYDTLPPEAYWTEEIELVQNVQ